MVECGELGGPGNFAKRLKAGQIEVYDFCCEPSGFELAVEILQIRLPSDNSDFPHAFSLSIHHGNTVAMHWLSQLNRCPLSCTQSNMEVRIAFDPRLEVACEEFAAHRSHSSDNLAIGRISVANPDISTGTFGEPSTAIAVLTGILLGVPSNAIWDAIKSTYQRLCASRKEKAKPVEIQLIEYPDGTRVTIVRMKE